MTLNDHWYTILYKINFPFLIIRNETFVLYIFFHYQVLFVKNDFYQLDQR